MTQVTNQRIQRYMADHASRQALRVSAGLPANPVHDEAYELISWMASDGGALMLADDAAWELISYECRALEDDQGQTWWQVPSLRPQLFDAAQDGTDALVSQAVRYLTARGLARQSAENSSLICPADEAPHVAPRAKSETAFS